MNKKMYVDVTEVCDDWDVSRTQGYKYKMSRPNVQKILYKNVQLVCLS